MFIVKIWYNIYIEDNFIKLEIYNDVIEEYLDNLEQTLKELHQNSCLMSEDVDEMLKNAKEQIYTLLKERT